MPIKRNVDKEFFKNWNSDMAYVVGFFAADGYLTSNKRGANFWCLQITDKDLLISIRSIVKSNHKINIRNGKNKVKDLYRLQIGSKSMCNDLRKLGMSERKTKSLSIPKVPTTFLADFIRGYFDGDGNVWCGYLHNNRITKLLTLRVTFTSCSLVFLNSLKAKLNDVCITNGVLSKGKGNYGRLVYSMKSSLKLYDFMYNQGTSYKRKLFLERKKVVFEKFIKMRP